MSIKLKLSNLLGLTEAFSSKTAAIIAAYSKFFEKDQKAFRGERKTYTPAVDALDVPTNRYNNKVTSTIDEKFDYLVKTIAPLLGDQLNVEATNASGTAKANLIVGDKDYGEFSSLELLRLKSFLNDSNLYGMLTNIPVRSDAKDWEKATGDYEDRSIYHTEIQSYEEKTTTKTEAILADPNVAASIAAGKAINYSPQKVTLTTLELLGSGTLTKYSGEWTHKQRAEALERLGELKKGVILALARANEVEVVPSNVPVKEILSYLLGR